MPGQGMCNRIAHSQKKQGRAFGVAPQVLDAAGQTFAEALHIGVRVDVVADVQQTRPKFLNSLRPGLPLLRHREKILVRMSLTVGNPGGARRNQAGTVVKQNVWSDGTRSEPGGTRQEPL